MRLSWVAFAPGAYASLLIRVCAQPGRSVSGRPLMSGVALANRQLPIVDITLRLLRAIRAAPQ